MYSAVSRAGEMSDSCAKTTSALYAISGTVLISPRLGYRHRAANKSKKKMMYIKLEFKTLVNSVLRVAVSLCPCTVVLVYFRHHFQHTNYCVLNVDEFMRIVP